MTDTKVSAYTEATTLADTDLLYAVFNAATTPVSRNIQFATIKALILAEVDTIVNTPGGMMINGMIVPSVTSNNLTLALKTLAGADPSTSDPVYIRIGNTVHSITAALSVTKNAGANWCNAGGTELATKEIDYFAYLGYNATDGVVIGFSRISHGTTYASFSATTTAETYAAISTITNAAATDEYHVIGRFAATLSAGAGYTWSVPTYTPANLIQRPIYETRWLAWAPQQSGKGSLTWTSPTVNVACYQITGPTLRWEASVAATLGGSASNSLYLTAPFQAAQRANAIAVGSGFAGPVTGTAWISSGTPDKIAVDRYDAANYATSGSLTLDVFGAYEI